MARGERGDRAAGAGPAARACITEVTWMAKLSGCIEMLFATEIESVHERLLASQRAGLQAGEFWSWRNKNLGDIAAALDEAGLELTRFLVEPPHAIVGPASHSEF